MSEHVSRESQSSQEREVMQRNSLPRLFRYSNMPRTPNAFLSAPPHSLSHLVNRQLVVRLWRDLNVMLYAG